MHTSLPALPHMNRFHKLNVHRNVFHMAHHCPVFCNPLQFFHDPFLLPERFFVLAALLALLEKPFLGIVVGRWEQRVIT